jgi:hypothetical protein
VYVRNAYWNNKLSAMTNSLCTASPAARLLTRFLYMSSKLEWLCRCCQEYIRGSSATAPPSLATVHVVSHEWLHRELAESCHIYRGLQCMVAWQAAVRADDLHRRHGCSKCLEAWCCLGGWTVCAVVWLLAPPDRERRFHAVLLLCELKQRACIVAPRCGMLGCVCVCVCVYVW